MNKTTLRLLTAFLAIPLIFMSCTDLEVEPRSSVTPDNFYQTEAELVAAVIPVYAALRDLSWGDPMHLQQVSSDEIFIPQRGGDWGDGDVWKDLHRHTWRPTLGFVNGGWTALYRGVARANSVIPNLEAAGSDLANTFLAEARVLRAFYYYQLMDLYGGVPIVTDPETDPDNPPSSNSRTQVFDFVVSEITEALPDLVDFHAGGAWGRVTKSAANAILSSVYLNAEVYTGNARWAEAVAAADAVINSGQYELLDNYTENFALANEGDGNAETVWAIGHRPEDGVGFNRHMASLHYNQLPATPWNGWSVVTDFYNRYDQEDDRTSVLLVGPQVVLGGSDAGMPATDRQGNPLNFTPEIGDLDVASENEGVRILKWEVDPAQSGGNAGNDFAIYRYAHVLLNKAEALLWQGQEAEARDIVNQVRARAFEPDKPLATLTADDMLNERGFELLWENVRRQDLIRHGKFTDAWTHKNASESFRTIFPIPQTQLDANPNLQQNPGY